MGLQISVLNASTSREIDAAFASLGREPVGADARFPRKSAIGSLVARYRRGRIRDWWFIERDAKMPAARTIAEYPQKTGWASPRAPSDWLSPTMIRSGTTKRSIASWRCVAGAPALPGADSKFLPQPKGKNCGNTLITRLSRWDIACSPVCEFGETA
jgi:hypothetical protein